MVTVQFRIEARIYLNLSENDALQINKIRATAPQPVDMFIWRICDIKIISRGRKDYG